MGLSSNLKSALTKNALIHDAQGLLGGILYPLIPTILNQNGWTGVALALGGAWVTGAIFNLPGLRAGAMGSFATHVMYTHVNPSIKDVLGRPLFRFKPNTVLVYRNPVTGEEETLGDDGLQANAQLVTLPTGEKVVGYNAQGMSDYNLFPSPEAPSGVNDYVNTNGMNDYVSTGGNGMNDYINTGLNDGFGYSSYNSVGDPINKNSNSII